MTRTEQVPHTVSNWAAPSLQSTHKVSDVASSTDIYPCKRVLPQASYNSHRTLGLFRHAMQQNMCIKSTNCSVIDSIADSWMHVMRCSATCAWKPMPSHPSSCKQDPLTRKRTMVIIHELASQKMQRGHSPLQVNTNVVAWKTTFPKRTSCMPRSLTAPTLSTVRTKVWWQNVTIFNRTPIKPVRASVCTCTDYKLSILVYLWATYFAQNINQVLRWGSDTCEFWGCISHSPLWPNKIHKTAHMSNLLCAF